MSQNPIKKLWPYGLCLFVLIIFDQALLHGLKPNNSLLGIQQRYQAFAMNWRPDQPHLIILGSSRGETALPETVLQKAIKNAGLPHKPVNLSIGGGGTPSLLYSALKQFTPILSQLNEASRVVYLFSFFELNFLRPKLLFQMPVGRELLQSFNQMAPPPHWSYQLRKVSGFARWVSSRMIGDMVPKLAHRILQESVSPFEPQRTLSQKCNMAGRYNYNVIPANDWAMRQFIKQLGSRFILVKVPVGQQQRAEDIRFGVEEGGQKYIQNLRRETAFRYIEDLGVEIDETGFTEADCDHIQRPDDQMRLAQRIVELLKN